MKQKDARTFVVLFVNSHKEAAIDVAQNIERALREHSIDCRYFSLQDNEQFLQLDDCVAAFSLGGDGTVLFTARAVAPLGIPIFPVHLGTLGFITALPPDVLKNEDDFFTLFKNITAPLDNSHFVKKCKKLKISKRIMLEVGVTRGGTEIYRGVALNDAVISGSGIAKLIRLQVTAFDRGEEIFLGVFRADGLIAATPTGSTAYSAAAGGPIVDPELEALIITPVCPFSLSNRPIVLPSHETVLIEVEHEQRTGVLLTLDGQVTITLESADKVFIRKAPYPALLVAADRQGFYKALRTKLR